MDIADAVSTEYTEFEPTTPVSKLTGAFEHTAARAFLVVDHEVTGKESEFRGIVTRKTLLSSHHQPQEKVASIMRDDVPRVQRTGDVREVARLMVESDLDMLPAYEGEQFRGVVTVDGLLRLVRPNLDAVTVDDVATYDLVTVGPDTTLGEVLHRLREHRISRVPVVEEGDPLGMISIYDLVGFVTRSVERTQGGDVAGFDGNQGAGSNANFRTHTGWGERAGEQHRLLDLPARDVMAEPVQTTRPDEELGDAVERMLDEDHSSLVVEGDEATPLGIMTTTDAIRALTWSEQRAFDVQVFGVDLLDDLSREAIGNRLLEIDEKNSAMDVIEANVVFHEHRERNRGVPLLQCTIRLFTDDGRHSGTGEGYGAAQAFREAADTVEENVLDSKGRGYQKQKSPEKREQLEKLLGWWLEA